MIALGSSLFRTEKNSIELLFDITCLVGKDLGEVVWCYAKETCGTVKDLRVGNVSSDILCIRVGKLKVAEEEDGDEETKNRCHVLLLEAERAHSSTEVAHSDGVVAEGTRRKTVAAGGSEDSIVRGILEIKSIALLRGRACEELVKDMVGAFFSGEAVETGFVEAVGEDLGGADAAAVIEMEFETTAVA